jgi:S1-C subfamily serine protease
MLRSKVKKGVTALMAVAAFALLVGFPVSAKAAGQYLVQRGAQVTMVDPGSAADNVGLEVGDTIVDINGTKIQSASNLVWALQHCGGVARLTVINSLDGQSTTVTAYPQFGHLGIDMQIVDLSQGSPYGHG